MLTSIVSTTSTLSSVLSTTTTVSMLSTAGVSEQSVLAVIALILLLSASEVLSASKFWHGRLAMALNMAIVPLCVAFLAIVVYRVADIL